MQITKLKKLISDNKLNKAENLLQFLKTSWEDYSEKDLRDIAEYANANRQKNSAYYTDEFIVKTIVDQLPIISKKRISVLEPAAGTGNFIYPLILRLAPHFEHIEITLNDLDSQSLKVAKFFLDQHNIPNNVSIKYTNYNFLDDLVFFNKRYDYIVGNPPFNRISLKAAQQYGNEITNLAGQFMYKALFISKIVGLVMPKNFLSTQNYESLRDSLDNKYLNSIIDFGERGFKGVLIETLAVIYGHNNGDHVRITSFIDNSDREIRASYVTDKRYPSWLLYRNSEFDKVAKNMKFNIFNAFRDRQLTNSKMTTSGDIRVVKSRNIAKDGTEIIDIPGYDRFISKTQLNSLTVSKFFHSRDVFLVPNMTYFPRMYKKDGDYVVNGSVAVLSLKKDQSISTQQVAFFSTDTFRNFYKIARNKGTRSLNIDNVSVFWFGKYLGELNALKK